MVDKKHIDNYINQAGEPTVSGHVEPVVSCGLDGFKVILMWNDKNKKDMYYVERLIEKRGKPDYYGPFHHEWNAEKFRRNEL